VKKLAVVTTHPIQYNAPLFRELARRKQVEIKVFYTWGQSQHKVFDKRFGIERNWDIPLLDGYEHEFIENTSRNPDSNRFMGIITPGLAESLQKYNPDAVLVYRWSVYSHLKIMRSLSGKYPIFFRGDSYIQESGNLLKNLLKKIILTHVYGRVNIAFYVGALNKAYYLKYGMKEDRLVYAPHAVDNSRFIQQSYVLEQRAAEERMKLGISDEHIVFLYAGKFYELKQLDVLIKVFKKLTGIQYKLLLYGNGEQEEELKQLAATDKRIIFQPFKNQSEMPWVYRVGNVFVLPSQSETWGLGVNEAMACGRPAIVSRNCGCARELIVEAKTGFSFAYNNEEQMLICFQKFTSVALAQEIGRNAAEHISQFSLERVAEVIEKTCNQYC
jgi:glycosyltransferase involved in cell wall biosynthesis